VFGARGSASFLSRATSILAVVFFSNCLLLAFLGGQREGPTSIVEQIASEPVPVPEAAKAPAAGAPASTATAAAPAAADVPAPAANSGAADVPNIPPAQNTP
jgi:preprotein translocase subunit SecG